MEIAVSADDAIEVYLGPDLSSKLEGILKDKCSDPGSPDCTTAVTEALGNGPTGGGLQRRITPLLAAGGIAAGIVAYNLVEMWHWLKQEYFPAAMVIPPAQASAIKVSY
jgi:hypothetical protein